MRKIGIVGGQVFISAIMKAAEEFKAMEPMQTTEERFKISEYRTHNSVKDYKDGRANRRERRAKNRKK